eukprot:TRINITY_DN632_c0_g1_i1.p1 TRINITY_DN632_c0_g1~~TRINITY_DN632_c0_g1_i1.p1  ORF type:complete len:190 (+),score=72.56 TRINITY_DN632_c0_g1_i1:134-703(+)
MAAATKPNYARVGEQVFKEVEKVNAELFTLTYGAIVAQLLRDHEDVEAVNEQLEKMGYNIGLRLIEEFLARSGVPRCSDFKETAEVISKVGFKMFLGVTASVVNWDPKKNEYSLILEENPLIDFVEVPEQYQSLVYSNILCGVLRGALEMVQMSVECRFVRDVLKGDDASEIKVTLKAILAEEVPVGED